ncbi:hypothetical protein GR7B_00151 [Vibrio phage vB_VcorM_GR7B]|nr:hypothetical protein GR7B_00151 [Vibrio phage vB_VcorM_GR7B]
MGHAVSRVSPKSSGGMELGEDIKNFIELRGSVECIVEENGIEWVAHHKPNLIVKLGAKALAHLLAEGDATYAISKFRIGTQGHNGTDITSPVAPTVDDTDLNDTTNFFEKNFVKPDDLTYLPSTDETQIQFTLVVEKTEGNPGSGSRAYTEAGLYSANGNLFARETFPAVVKTDQRKITFRWTILFD